MSEKIPSESKKKSIEAVYPLSPMQQGMLFHSLYAPESGVYFEQLICTLRGDLNLNAFRLAWQEVANRQSVLRTSFVWKRLDRTLQVVQKDVELPVYLEDWREDAKDNQEKKLHDYLKSDRAKGFNLGKPPLMRLALVRIADDAHYFIWSHHHALIDGWSVSLLLAEVFAYYKAFSQGSELSVKPVRPYREYIAWLNNQDPATTEQYWRQVLRGFSAPTPLVVDRLSGEGSKVGQSFAPVKEQEFQFDLETTSEINMLVRRRHLTLSTLIQASWALLLSKYSGEQDVLFGATVSGRPANLPGSDSMIGLFINTLPFRVNIQPDMSVIDWLQTLQTSSAAARQYEYSSLVQIQEWSEIPRGTPLFESILVFENYPVEETLRDQTSGIKIENILSYEQTNYPLAVISGPGDRLGVKISYDSNRFDDSTIRRMLGHIEQIINAIVADPAQPVSQLSTLTVSEIHQLLVEWNNNDVAFPDDVCIHQIFEQQVSQQPDAVAVIYEEFIRDSKQSSVNGGQSMVNNTVTDKSAYQQKFRTVQISYGELNQRANILARYLQSIGVGSEKLVGISIERSLDMIVAILGVLKAGGAYLPLDANYPIERLKFMIEDAKIPVLLGQEHTVKRIYPEFFENGAVKNAAEPVAPIMICLDRDWAQIEAQVHAVSQVFAGENVEALVKPDNLAYVIYTSGSTGKPKGTLLRHRGLCNLVVWQKQALGISDNQAVQSRVLQFASFSFDASVFEIFMALANGAILVMADQEVMMDVDELPRLLKDASITIAVLPPSLLKVIPEERISIQELPDLETVISAGEACTREIVDRWAIGRRFYNGYGPTESTVSVSVGLCTPGDQRDPSIGRPLNNIHVYIVDDQFKPVPVGVPGELLVGGLSLAKGYLDRPELTSQKFIPNPFAAYLREFGLVRRAEEQLYRTGDLVRYRPDGNLEFIGRIDQQVKIRGFRIELGEIEAALEQHPRVQSAVVIAAANSNLPGDQELVAYIVGAPDHPVEYQLDVYFSNELRNFLSERLPDYMVPSIYIGLDAIPLSPSGKVDRKALPAPEHSELKFESAYIAPRTPVEGLIAGVWEQVLNVPRVGVFDNFFNSGGHSLNATQVMSRLRNIFQVEIPLRDLFEATTIAGLAERVEATLQSRTGLDIPVIEPLPRDPNSGLPLTPPEISFAQQRLWFLDQLSPGNLFYNLPLAVLIEGQLDVLVLENVLNEIIRRHSVLRTNFLSVHGKPVQVISPYRPIKLEITDLSTLPESDRFIEAERLAAVEARRSFDLSKDSLIRIGLLRLGDDQHVFLLTMHHIVSDGWSMGVFLREVAALYPALSQGQSSPLPDLQIQYFDFAHWQRSWLQGEQLQRQLDYWKQTLANQPRVLNLPTDYPRPAVQSWQGATENFDIPLSLLDQLNELSRQEGVTLFMTLLAAYQVLLFRYTGQSDISIGTAIANRNRSEIEPLIGFFVNTLVMRMDLSSEPSFQDLLVKVREMALGAYAHQDLPFEMLVETLQPERDLSHTPLFQVAFALQNAPTSNVLTVENTTGILNQSSGGLRFKPLQVDSGSAKFDLTLSLAESPDGLLGSIEYNLDLFKPDTIQRMIIHLKTLLSSIIDDPGHSITTLPLLSEAERKQVLVEWNLRSLDTGTVTSVTLNQCAHELFEAQVKAKPDGCALIFEDQFLSYRELNGRAEKFAAHLRAIGVEPDQVVGISAERSIELVIGILAIMKAGGAYLPLDPNYPADRLAYMLSDSGIQILLIQSPLLPRLPEDWKTAQAGKIVLLDDGAQFVLTPAEENTAGSEQSIVNRDQRAGKNTVEHGLPKNVSPDNLAYVIYTSGSTGRPKGTLLRHRGLSNLTEAQRKAFGITEKSRVLQFSPSSFDASVWEMFMALANGATLVLARQDVLASGSELLQLLHEQKITTVTLPPSVLRLFSADRVNRNALPDLQTVISAGEACTQDIVDRWAPGRDFFNAYGPTETTVCASIYHCSPGETQSPPIGCPIANTILFILDHHLQPVPIGVPGELFVSGVSLAKGYINQPEMTAEKFINNPFIHLFEGDKGYFETLYKTGDLVKYRSDGNIEFLGRIDQQVKVRGFRIELGEIETALSDHPDIEDAAVIVRDTGDGETRLIAFISPNIHTLDGNEIRNYLRKILPEYMLPSVFVILEALPTTPSGKIDRKALAALQISERYGLKNEYIAPRNDVESQLAEICTELLRVEKVGVFDNFFELGGHSLLATQFVSRIKDTFQVDLSLRKLFESPNIAAIADYIQQEQVVIPDKDTSSLSDRARLEQLLQKIDQLSDEDVKMMLEQKKASIGKNIDDRDHRMIEKGQDG